MKLLKIFLLACIVMITGIYGAEGSQSNILWHNSTTGAVKFMPINNIILENTLAVVDSSNTNLLPKGMGDFTGDGQLDILFHNQNSGNLRIWEMDGTAKVDNIQILGSSNTNLQIAGVGDFDGDGDNDIATFNTNSGALRIWVMEGTIRVDNVLVLTGANINLIPSSANDMDGDGIPDLVLRNNNSGAVRVWTMNADFTRKGNEYVTGSSNTNLELRGVMDINSDGNNDILNYNTNTGKLRAWLMDGDLKISENAEVIQDAALEWSVRGVYSIVSNVAPIANAGSVQNIPTSSTVILDGSGSFDVDHDMLTHQWSIRSKPLGSNSILSDTTSVRPSFVTDMDGSYVIQLIVNDGIFNSAAAIVTITASTVNSAPVAKAGVDLSVRIQIGAVIGLNGAMSSDADGDLITHQWSIVSKPADSNTILIDANSVMPTFVPDTDGVYEFELIVNDGIVDSAVDVMTVTVTSYIPNSAPVADAGDDQNIKTTSTVTLDGSASFDVDADIWTYSWSITSKPTDSDAQLSDATFIKPTFVADLDGIYVIQLIVDDGNLSSILDTVIITASTDNSAPVADAGEDQNVIISSTVTLDGSASYDADMDGLTYEWSIISKPEGSLVDLSDPAIFNPIFIPDLPGAYLFELIVGDKRYYSVPARLIVTASPIVGFADNGFVTYNSAAGGNSTDTGNGVVLDSDGNIYVTGYSLNVAGNWDMVIWKYTNEGVLDTSFGGVYDGRYYTNGDGIAVYDGSRSGFRPIISSDVGNAIALDSAGNIYVTGSRTNTTGKKDMVIWKYTNKGILDTGFSDDGIVVYDGGDIDDGNAIALDDAGNVYVTGYSYSSTDDSYYGARRYDMVIWKYKSDGTFDETFNHIGRVEHHSAADGHGNDVGNAIALDSAGNIYVTGYSEDDDDLQAMVIWKYKSNGDPDKTFYYNGYVVYEEGLYSTRKNYFEFGYAIALDSAGNIYVAGSGGDIVKRSEFGDYVNDVNMLIWKYKSDGTRDSIFGVDGIVTAHDAAGGNWRDYGYAMALDIFGNVYVTGSSQDATSRNAMVIWKYDSDGEADNNFGNDGVVVQNIANAGNYSDSGSAIALDGIGNIYVAGQSEIIDNDDDMVLWKYKQSLAIAPLEPVNPLDHPIDPLIP